MIKQLLIFMLLFGSIWYTSQAQIKVSGEFRTRTMVDHGFKYPVIEGSQTEFYVDQRSRLKLDYSQEKYSFRFTLQDARIWGGDDIVNKSGMFGNSGSLGIYESWVNFNLSEFSKLKIGRQEWNYDDMRILSYRDWLTGGQSYDGILYQYKKNNNDIDIGISYNNNGDRHGIINNAGWEADKLKTLNFVRYKYAFNAKCIA
jgi:hypothetical protein